MYLSLTPVSFLFSLSQPLIYSDDVFLTQLSEDQPKAKAISQGGPLKLLKPDPKDSVRIAKSIEEFNLRRSHPEFVGKVPNPAGKELEQKKAKKDQITMEEDRKRNNKESYLKEFDASLKKKQDETKGREFAKEQKEAAEKKKKDAKRKKDQTDDKIVIFDKINQIVKATAQQMVATQAATLKQQSAAIEKQTIALAKTQKIVEEYQEAARKEKAVAEEEPLPVDPLSVKP